MAAVRHNRPTIIVYGGTIQPGIRHVDCPALGKSKGDDMTAVDAFESYGAFVTGKITEEERFDVVRHSCPGPGGCGGMFTLVPFQSLYRDLWRADPKDSANTMSSALEVLGMSLPFSASTPAVYQGMCTNISMRIHGY